MNFIAIDFETASAQSPWSACQMGLVDVRNGRMVEHYESLINPGCSFDYRCVRIHGIEEEDVLDAASLHGAMAFLREKLDGRTIVAHNAGFDTGVMKAAMEREGVVPPDVQVICTVSASRRAFPNRESYSLTKMTDLVGEYQAHDALADAHSCAKLLLLCAKECGAKSMEELIETLGLLPGRFNEREYVHCKVIPQNKRKARKEKGHED